MVDTECLSLSCMPKDGEALSLFRKLTFYQLTEFVGDANQWAADKSTTPFQVVVKDL